MFHVWILNSFKLFEFQFVNGNSRKKRVADYCYDLCCSYFFLTHHTLLSLRILCPGDGLPPELVQDMFHNSWWVTEEGLGLSTCRKLLKLMNGEVQYVRESVRCYFLVSIELPTSSRAQSRGSWGRHWLWTDFPINNKDLRVFISYLQMNALGSWATENRGCIRSDPLKSSVQWDQATHIAASHVAWIIALKDQSPGQVWGFFFSL